MRHMELAVPRARSNKGAILFALCLAALIINIDVTIVNVTLPSLVRELGATTTNLQWVVDAYSLVFAALILAAGSLSDRVGRKGMLLAGLGVFAAGSLAGSRVHTAGELIAARAVMGLGAAAIFPSTLSLIANVFTERAERAKAIGLWGATTGVGVATGPIVGGWLLGHFWWGSVFLFMVPVAAFVAAMIAWAVPTSRDPSAPPIDWRGLILSSAGMATLILSIIQAPNWGWGSGRTLGLIATGVVILAVFVFVENRTARPMLDVSLFRNMRFTAASGSAGNDATRLSGAALGVAVMGSIAASLYGSRLAATLPKGLPSQTLVATKGSVGGALVVVQSMQRAGLSGLARELRFASTGAFLHSMNGAMIVAGTIAMLGALMAAVFLPSRPALALAQTAIVRLDEEPGEIDPASPSAESVS